MQGTVPVRIGRGYGSLTGVFERPEQQGGRLWVEAFPGSPRVGCPREAPVPDTGPKQ
jgi:hypothetical protein